MNRRIKLKQKYVVMYTLIILITIILLSYIIFKSFAFKVTNNTNVNSIVSNNGTNVVENSNVNTVIENNTTDNKVIENNMKYKDIETAIKMVPGISVIPFTEVSDEGIRDNLKMQIEAICLKEYNIIKC